MKTTESDIENLALEELEDFGWAYYAYGPDLASNGKTPKRHGYGDVLLMGRLKDAIRKLNTCLQNCTKKRTNCYCL